MSGTADELVLAGLAGVLGTCIGSFLNVVIHRLPLGESVVHPPSRCPGCGSGIRWHDNLPVIGWLLLRGHCRDCGAPISPRYPIVELLVGLLAAGIALRLGPTIDAVAWFFFAATLVALTYIDLDHQLLPDRLTLPGIAAGLIFAALSPPAIRLEAVRDSAVGILAGGGILWFVAWAYHAATGREGMGGGDVKLLAMIGAFLGWRGVLLSLLLASFLGSAVGVALMVRRGADAKLAIPFGPFLAAGALVSLFWGPALVDWYLVASGLSAG